MIKFFFSNRKLVFNLKINMHLDAKRPSYEHRTQTCLVEVYFWISDIIVL